jgi:hypothetical protein
MQSTPKQRAECELSGEPGAALLDEVYTFLGRFVAYPSKHARVAHTLWIAHTHLMDAWDSTPRNVAGGHQQVNNGVEPDKLDEVTHEQAVDTGAPPASGRCDSDMAPVGAIERPAHGRG